MAVSEAQSPTSPDLPASGDKGSHAGLRASDAERDEAAGELGEHFAAGRLSHDTFLYRMNTALRARHRADLPPLFADLPPRQRPRGFLSAGWEGAGAMVSRVLNAVPSALSALPSGLGLGMPPPGPGRRLTSGFPAAPGSRPSVMLLPFPRGAQATFTIGRDRECDLAIDDLTVSRIHAELERTADGWMLVDRGSTNGTRINGWRVRDAVRVRAGDLVRFGESEFALADAEDH
ncbi:MAG TPA: DUF1707 and FHA domain-containing protein [Trebonia sp.]